MKYEQATFRLLIDNLVQVEVSIKGCDHDRQHATVSALRDAARTADRIARAVQKIQRDLDHTRGKRAVRDQWKSEAAAARQEPVP